jgi:separase
VEVGSRLSNGFSLEVYLEAQGLFQNLDLEEKGMSTRDRVVARAKNLEITATAAHVFATIQFAQVC